LLDRLRHYFALGDLQLKLYLLATLTGLLAGGGIILFRLLIDYAQISIFPSGKIEDFASVHWLWIMGLPVIGGLLIGLLFNGLDPPQRGTGVVHVIERLSYHEGKMPWANLVRQFIGAAIALISGHSVGRESPSIHIGAASGSFFGMNLDLPNNATRILVASGAAAAISASFDTPIAGVIFAMEVIMMEYHIATFIPIILASVSGAVLGRLVFEESPFFGLVATQMQSLWEVPYIILLGVFLGLVAVLFIRSLSFFSGFLVNSPIWLRTTLAGLLVGMGGLMMPDVMGMSYNLINTAHLSEMAIPSLLLLLVLKLILSSACVGLSIPGGLIGPTLVIGAAGGAILGHIGHAIYPELSSSIGFYAMIGMCAMMGATLKAPLAGLMALLELTSNPHIILPGMLAIVFSSIIVFEVFKLDSVFLILLRKRGLDYRSNPLTQALRRINVSSAMQTEFVILPAIVSREEAKTALSESRLWVVIEQESGTKVLLLAADLACALNEEGLEEVDLLQIPASRQALTKISINDSLQEAASLLKSSETEALYVIQRLGLVDERITGILTKEIIEAQYQLSYN
jgi:CIC family chloride channel protein